MNNTGTIPLYNYNVLNFTQGFGSESDFTGYDYQNLCRPDPAPDFSAQYFLRLAHTQD